MLQGSSMLDFLYQQSDLMVFVIVAAMLILISAIALLVIKHYFMVKGTYEDNAVIANISSIIGVIYGVLAGLSALYLLNNISYSYEVVQKEASSAANVYQLTKFLKEPVQSDIQQQLRHYLEVVINDEWPLMSKRKPINDNDLIANMIDSISRYADKKMIDSATLHDLINDIKSLYNSREERIQLSSTSLSIEIWEVVMIGTFLIIVINFFFRMSYRLHLVALLAEIIMASSVIFLLITLDTPFEGDYIVQPSAYQSLLGYMQKHP